MKNFSENFQHIHYKGFAAYREFSKNLEALAEDLLGLSYRDLESGDARVELVCKEATKRLGYSLLPCELMSTVVDKAMAGREVVDAFIGALSKLTGMSDAVYELRYVVGGLEYVIRDWKRINAELGAFLIEVDENHKEWEARQMLKAA